MSARLMIAGTTSDAGKSVVTTALCRAFARRGIAVAPYKAQNMSNNSMVCADESGTTAEIGRAQWIQALAAHARPEPAMNPVLLKPGSDRRSHVVAMGKPAGTISSMGFVEGRRHLAVLAHDAFDDLASRYELVIAEGAGSPTEINLRDSDYVNMGLAQHARMPVVVVGDIDRGGVFAAFYGTVALLDAADQALVAGFVVNKFRGDERLLRPGLDAIEERTGRRVYGTLPWDARLWLDSEDALDLEGRRDQRTHDPLRVVVIRLPRISNFTDVDALALEPGIDVRFVSDVRGLDDADLVVLPGSRTTISDLAWLRARGLDEAIIGHAHRGGAVLGICGGFQMLGRSITDEAGVEGDSDARVEGLGLLDVETRFETEKVLRLPAGEALGHEVSGYEIHHGRVTVHGGEPFLGGARDGSVWGTMWHGGLESDGFRRALLAEVADSMGRGLPESSVSFASAREARIDLLADLAESHLDLDALLDLATSGAGRMRTLA
ncbi:cobyric acid synthase CobQ [Aeromicrobium sp. PE09-221]|uniref:cobyric acid synthase n=1 Tax=Aeromicrobium sp. PE09-221 TaxID=1898043 RepID=UPI000B3E766A|nr:cobyric acid synthase [Aeromicrobium sp. PE09-221]OUZ07549.1 cobyric acid synthase CobQ [Aeromicrobium sp. PE09-221]